MKGFREHETKYERESTRVYKTVSFQLRMCVVRSTSQSTSRDTWVRTYVQCMYLYNEHIACTYLDVQSSHTPLSFSPPLPPSPEPHPLQRHLPLSLSSIVSRLDGLALARARRFAFNSVSRIALCIVPCRRIPIISPLDRSWTWPTPAIRSMHLAVWYAVIYEYVV